MSRPDDPAAPSPALPPRATPGRREELAAGLDAVRRRITVAARASGRDPADVRLVVVTKTFPAADTVLLAQLGVREVGESREPDASAKAVELAALADSAHPDSALLWHQVGQVQTRKAPAVARWAHVVHSVDRLRLVAALDAAARGTGRRLECFLQVSLDGDPARGGAPAASVPPLADAVDAADGLVLAGLMALPAVGVDPRAAFERLAHLAVRLRADHPHARQLSAGMSEDLEAAVEAGATLVRVGRAVMGDRPSLR